MLLHTENVDNVDNFVNNYRLSIFSMVCRVDNSAGFLGKTFDNFFTFFLNCFIFVHYAT